jgi:hypothetical protein
MKSMRINHLNLTMMKMNATSSSQSLAKRVVKSIIVFLGLYKRN